MLNAFHLRHLRRILAMNLSDFLANTEVLSRAGLQIPVTLLQQGRLRWLGYILRMEDVRTPRTCSTESWLKAREHVDVHTLGFSDVCKWDLQVSWHWCWKVGGPAWPSTKISLDIRCVRSEAKQRKAAEGTNGTAYKCSLCKRDCHSRVGDGQSESLTNKLPELVYKQVLSIPV